MAFRYALFSLPGIFEKILTRVFEAGIPPAILITPIPVPPGNFPILCLDGKAPGLAKTLLTASLDALFVAGWESKLEKSLCEGFPRGAWNVHPSLLPAYRGRNPYFWVIAKGEVESGITVHRLTEKFDEGPILFQKKMALTRTETLGSLWHRSASLSADALVEAMNAIISGVPETQPQPEGVFPTGRRVTQEDMHLKETATLAENERLVRATNPFFGAIMPGVPTVRVLEARLEGPGPEIKCCDGVLYATVIQIPDYGILSGESYLKLNPLSGN